MAAATLGDFLDTANEHLALAGSGLRDGLRDRAGAARQLGRIAGSVARYLDAVTRADAVARPGVPDWELSAVYMREGARTARAYLDRAAGSAAGPPLADDPVVRHLGLAADALVVGGDLLWSHLGTDSNGGRVPRSDWVPLLGSEPFVLAVADEAAGWAQRAVRVLDYLAGDPGQVQGLPVRALADACGLLSAVVGTRVQAGAADHDMVERRELLRALPSPVPPERVPPSSGESDADLCDGISASARRLRSAAFASSRLKGDSPFLAGEAWTQSALASAVLSDIACGITGMLADRSAALGMSASAEAGLRDASVAFAQACSAWGQVTGMWRRVRTVTRFPSSPAVVEAGDLVLRMGRLLHGKPDWTPAAKHRAPARDPGSLAGGRPELVRALAAVHDCADAIARSARADLAGIRAAGAAGRLYMSNRIVANPRARSAYVPLSGYRAHLLTNAYHIGIAASIRAATALDAAAVGTQAPTRALGLMRAAAGDLLAPEPGYETDLETFVAQRLKHFDRPTGSILRSHTELDADAVIRAYTDAGHSLAECADRFTASVGTIKTVLLENGYRPYLKWPDGESRARPAANDRPGAEEQAGGLNSDAPVTSILKELGVNDHSIYVRAAAIDRAASDLISRATTAAPRTSGQERSAAQLASLDRSPGANATPDRKPAKGPGAAKASRTQDTRHARGRRA